MLRALRQGLRAVSDNVGLVLLVWAANLALAALLALPLARLLERDMRHTEAAANMMYGFDYGWWSAWHDRQKGWTGSLGPEILGSGFAYKNVDLLLRGELPLRLFAARPEEGEEERADPGLDSVILGLGFSYLLVQTFLAGGLLGVFRNPQGGWTVRGLFHGGGFYFGRLLRVAGLTLLLFWMVFRLAGPFNRWVDGRALQSVSESTALVWSFSRYAILAAALAAIHMVSSYAKVIVAVEERSSAILAFLSSASFCLQNLRRTAGQYVVLAIAAGLLFLAWKALDNGLETVGYKTQLVTLALAEALVLARVGLRLGLLASQTALFRGLRDLREVV
jgi:hypothetical protein